MQVAGKQQSIECFGWKMLPGVCCANKAMDFEIHFKVHVCPSPESRACSVLNQMITWRL